MEGGSMSIPQHVETLIVGAGASGICMAIKLLEAGRTSFLLLDRAAEVGGTWSANRYPGCACDVPSHLYSFSFRRNPHWTSFYASRPEIQRYLHDSARAHGILPRVRLRVLVREAVWDDGAKLWRLAVSSSSRQEEPKAVAMTISCKYLVRAVGAYHSAKYPSIPGAESFSGLAVHSSAWDESLLNHEFLRGKTVAVIGTGASSVQIVPVLAPLVEKLYVVQRTPAWVLPKLEAPIPLMLRRVLQRAPLLMWLLTWLLYVVQECMVMLLVGGRLARGATRRVAQWVAKMHLHRAIGDPSLREALTPRYDLGCKRILLSNTFYPALSRPNVELILGHVVQLGPARTITFHALDPSSPLTSRRVDILIFATGFDLSIHPLRILGRGGLALEEAGPASFLGVTKHGFPNLFLLYGPNTNLGHNSILLMIEAQARYIISCMNFSSSSSMELKNSTQDAFQELLHLRMSQTVWLQGKCTSYYIDPHTGTNNSTWPATTLEYLYGISNASKSPSDYNFE